MSHPLALVVDDDSEFRHTLAEILRDEDCRVVEAANGEEAMEILDSIKPDVILVDLIMPVMNGWSLFAAIERRQDLCDVPIVFMSGAPQMAPGGGSLVLKKPFDLPTLLCLLKAMGEEPSSGHLRVRAIPRTTARFRSHKDPS
jgi:two-component system, OmpR family, response regulator